MHRVFSIELSIALMNVEDFFKCTLVTISWEFWIDHKRECVCVLFLEKIVHLFEHVWRPFLVLLQLFEYTRKKIFGHLLVASFTRYCSKCNKNMHLCKNLGTWKLIGSPHRLCKLSINLTLAHLLVFLLRAKSKHKLERSQYVCTRDDT
jgi:hypothetical protein